MKIKKLRFLVIGSITLATLFVANQNKEAQIIVEQSLIQVINEQDYPPQLIELANKKQETIEFVYDYVNRSAYMTDHIDISTDYVAGKIPLFLQWDKRWGYNLYGDDFMAINGCGPTTLSMVIVGLTGDCKINPKVVADFSMENGYWVDQQGTSWSLMSEGGYYFGINSEELPLSESVICNRLNKGMPIIVSMGPGDFTTEGHFIVLTGLDKEGKLIVNDPDSRVRSGQRWDLSVIMEQAKNLWAFTLIDNVDKSV